MNKRICILISLLALNTSAAEVVDREEIVVTATRDECLLQSAPYYGDILDDDMLRTEKAVRTVPEALKYQTGTFIQKTGHGQGSPYIRGFTGFRNLLMIDGIRLNNSIFRDGPNQYWNTVDALGLNRLESVRGPFSVLYGSDAVGGTVNAITRGAVNLRPGSTWDKRLYYRYADAENSNIGRFESIGVVSDNLILSLGYTFKDFSDLVGGNDVGIQKKTGYYEQDWDAKLEYFLSDDTWLTFAHQCVDLNNAWRTHKTIYGIDWEGLSVGKEFFRILDQDRKLTYLQYHQHNMDGFCDEIHAGVSHHLQEEKRDRLRTPGRHDVQGFDVNTAGAFVQFKSLSPVGELIYGTEYYHDEVNSFKDTLNADGTIKSSSIQGPVGDDATYDMLGIYLQDNITVADPVSVLLGCRYDYAAANADSVEDPNTGDEIQISDDWGSVVGSGRVLYHLNNRKSCNLFAGISQGFRAPNLSDLTRLDSARTDEIETPSPDLDPEKFVSYEIGMKTDGKELSGQLAYFYTDIQDMIVRTPTGRMIEEEYEVTKRNAGDGYVQGIELSAQYTLPASLKAFGAFTWMDGKVETYPTSDPVLVEEYIDRLMPPTGRVGLRWDMNKKYWLEGSCTIAAKADKLSTRDKSDTSRIPPGGTPGYTAYDLRAGYNVSKDVTISAAVENITDEDYRVHGSGVNEPGQNIIVTTDWVF
ncbi:TonB-dependent receptor [Verrucomicrobiota bacterium]